MLRLHRRVAHSLALEPVLRALCCVATAFIPISIVLLVLQNGCFISGRACCCCWFVGNAARTACLLQCAGSTIDGAACFLFRVLSFFVAVLCVFVHLPRSAFIAALTACECVAEEKGTCSS